MASMLDEIMRRKQEGKPVIELPRISPAVQEAYLLILAGEEINPDFFGRQLQHEAEQCEALINTVNALSGAVSELQCYYFRTDSSSIGSYRPIFDQYLKPGLKNSKILNDESLFIADLVLMEAYTNAITHGNKGGIKELYRGMPHEPPPSDDELEVNRKKSIAIESMICDRFYMFRVTDVGKGGAEEHVRCGRDDDPDCTKGGRGLYLIKSLSDCLAFHRQQEPQEFSITTIKYKHAHL